jgi:cytochrome c biogenesis protein CcmG/thiol:disulfide interchange protein DsbE
MKRWIALLPLAGFVVLAALFFSRVHHDPHYVPAALVGKPLPVETLPAMDGGAPTRLAAEAPPGTVINFFASWCVPCVQEQPALMALKAQGVKIIGVVSPWRYDAAATQAMLAKGDPYAETLLDPTGKATLDFGVSGVPETFVVGKGGRIAVKYAEPLDAQTAETVSEAVDKAR